MAQTRLGGEAVFLHRIELVDEPSSAAPGTITRVERDRLVVAAGQGSVAIVEIQVPGKRVMSVSDYLRGHSLRPGERFEDL